MSGLRCYLTLQSMNLQEKMAQIAAAWIIILLFIVEQMAGLIFLWIIFSKTKSVGGWSLPEMAFLFGMYQSSLGLYRLLFQGVTDTGYLILSGAMDQLLTKPRSTLLLVICRRSNYHGLADLVIGLAVILVAAAKMQFTWTPVTAGQLALCVVSGNAIVVGIMMVQAAFCFWILRFNALNELVLQARDFCKYPISIYGRFVRILLMTVMPMAFATYVPASAMLGKEGMSTAWLVLPPLAGCISIGAGILFFQRGLKVYEGSGS